MKKFIAFLFVLIFSVCMLSSCGDDAIVSTDQKIYVASGHPEWWPIMFKNQDLIDGVGPKLANKIMTNLGLNLSCQYEGSWENVLDLLKTGLIDMICGAYKTSEREIYYDFSDPYTTDPISLFVKTGDGFVFTKWEDLKNKQGVAMSGDSYGQEFDNYIIDNNLPMVRVGTVAEALSMLENNQADYFVYSYYGGRKVIGDSYKGQYESLPTYVAEENFYIAISKKSQLRNYMPQINELIKKYKDDGTIDIMIQEYMQSL